MELMGVYDEALVEPLAQVMANLGVTRGMVVYGQDKLDEISMSAPTSVCEIKDGNLQAMRSHRSSSVMTRCEQRKLYREAHRKENAEITKAILKGEEGCEASGRLHERGSSTIYCRKSRNIEKVCVMAEQLIDSGAALAETGRIYRGKK